MSKNSLFDDPLGLSSNNSNNSNNNEITKKGLLFDEGQSNNDTGLFKTLDSSKINLKKDKNNQKTNTIQQATTKPINASEKGLGFTTSLWESDVSNSKVDDLLNDISLKTTPSSNDTLFGGKVESKVKADALAEIGIKINQNPNQNNTKGGKVNIGDLDDNKLDDLKVGKLIEKEDDLDYELFGKKNIVQARSVGTILHKQKNVSQTDLEIESAEVLDNLEKVALKDNVFTSKTIVPQSSPSTTVNTNINPDDIDMTKFDINAYINENSSGGGGLFD